MIPIFIINRDRLVPLKELVKFLFKRNYTNITIIDNGSTYKPLLDWYRGCPASVYHNETNQQGNESLHHLAYTFKIEPFYSAVTSGNFVLTDSDINPIPEIPDNFIEDMAEVCNRYKKHKVGLGLKIDDMPDHFYNKGLVLGIESPFWRNHIVHKKIPLYQAPIDTTFAVYGKGTVATHGMDCFRTGGNYVARHAGWYYDYDNLPEDESHYLKNLKIGQGLSWSEWSKQDKNL